LCHFIFLSNLLNYRFADDRRNNHGGKICVSITDYHFGIVSRLTGGGGHKSRRTGWNLHPSVKDLFQR